MPIIEPSFSPPLLLSGGHVQTILSALSPRRISLKIQREKLELADEDFVDLDWMRAGNRRLAILTHGLEGSSANGYIRGMARALLDAGWDALAWNFRGCGGQPNRLARFYHGGDTRDLAAIIEHATATYPQIALIGFSLGGNITLKYLGEPGISAALVAGAGISVPIDLAASSRALDQRFCNRIYLSRFMKTLVAKVRAKAPLFPTDIDLTGIDTVRTFAEFDDRYTAPLHGFRGAADYWSRSSARQYLPRVTVPTLLLNALNDPFLTPECFPHEEARQNPALLLETPKSGGHVGFLDFSNGWQPWSERRVVQFLASLG